VTGARALPSAALARMHAMGSLHLLRRGGASRPTCARDAGGTPRTPEALRVGVARVHALVGCCAWRLTKGLDRGRYSSAPGDRRRAARRLIHPPEDHVHGE